MKLKYTKMATFTASLITFGSLTGGANAATINFDDAWASVGETGNPSSFYSTTHGVTISGNFFGVIGGVGNGDVNNWYLEGTAGSAFLGTNSGRSGNPTFTFSAPQMGTIDIGVGNGWTSNFLISGSLGRVSVFSRSISINDDNNGQGTWRTFAYSGAIDTLQVQLTSGTAQAYGIDNLNFTAVPEPSSAFLFGLGSLGFIAHRRKIR